MLHVHWHSIYIYIFIYIYMSCTFSFTFTLQLHLYYHFCVFFTKRNLAQYLHRSALQAPYFACAEIWSIAMFLTYQRASRPYKRLVFDDLFLSSRRILFVAVAWYAQCREEPNMMIKQHRSFGHAILNLT